MDNELFNSVEFRRSRNAYTVQCAVEHMVYLMVTDAFLAKLLKHIGLSDAIIGVISSLISFAFLVQLLAILLMRHMKNVKRTVVITDMLSMLLYMSTYLIPFLKVSGRFRTVLVFVCVLGGAVMRYLTMNMYYRWANSYVHPYKRASFSAVKEMISLGCGILLSLGVGFLVDRFEAAGNLKASFLLIALVIFTLSVVNLVTLLMIRNIDETETASQQKSFSEVAEATFKNRSFMNILLLTCIVDVGTYMTMGFLGTFKTVDLLYSVGAVQLINMAGNFSRLLLSKPFGAYSDRSSFANGYLLGLLLALAGVLCLVFTTNATRWLIIVYAVLYNIAQAGISANSYNMMYSYVPADCFVQAQAIKSSISGTLGFLASLLGSAILKKVQANGNVFLGIPMYGQQLLAFMSAVLFLAAILFMKFVVSKQKVMRQ